MPDKRVKVAINGYGVIGKRVADAVVLQDDMELAGICDIIHDYRIRVAMEKSYRIFASTSDKLEEMKAGGIPVVKDDDAGESPRRSTARYALDDCREIQQFLEALTETLQGESP